ncbi:restless-like transposase, partial [Metarhizium majus ARSEF 297]
MSDYIASDDQTSLVSSPCTPHTNPISLGEFRCGSECSQDVNVDDSLHVPEGAYTGINWDRLAGYIQPGQKMEKRGWFWDYGYDVQKGTDIKARFWLCRACHTAHPSRTVIFVSRGVDNIKNHLLKHHQLDRDGRPAKRRKHEFDILQLEGIPILGQLLCNVLAIGNTCNSGQNVYCCDGSSSGGLINVNLSCIKLL